MKSYGLLFFSWLSAPFSVCQLREHNSNVTVSFKIALTPPVLREISNDHGKRTLVFQRAPCLARLRTTGGAVKTGDAGGCGAGLGCAHQAHGLSALPPRGQLGHMDRWTASETGAAGAPLRQGLATSAFILASGVGLHNQNAGRTLRQEGTEDPRLRCGRSTPHRAPPPVSSASDPVLPDRCRTEHSGL